MKSEVLSVKEKIGYGMGDAASHIIFDNTATSASDGVPFGSSVLFSRMSIYGPPDNSCD